MRFLLLQIIIISGVYAQKISIQESNNSYGFIELSEENCSDVKTELQEMVTSFDLFFTPEEKLTTSKKLDKLCLDKKKKVHLIDILPLQVLGSSSIKQQWGPNCINLIFKITGYTPFYTNYDVNRGSEFIEKRCNRHYGEVKGGLVGIIGTSGGVTEHAFYTLTPNLIYETDSSDVGSKYEIQNNQYAINEKFGFDNRVVTSIKYYKCNLKNTEIWSSYLEEIFKSKKVYEEIKMNYCSTIDFKNFGQLETLSEDVLKIIIKLTEKYEKSSKYPDNEFYKNLRQEIEPLVESPSS